MQIEIGPETERLIREEIRSGHFRSVGEMIEAGVEAFRQRSTLPKAPGSDARNLVELFENSPFKGLNIEFERDRDYGREIDL